MSGSTQPQARAGNGEQPAPKRKRNRSPSMPKPAFVIMQLLGDDNQPMQFDKRRVKVVAVERQAEKVLEAVESGAHPNAFYLRVIVPVAAGARKAASA